MRKASAVSDLGLGLDGALRVLDERSGPRPRRKERLVSVGHATAQPDGSHQGSHDQQAAATTTGFILILGHGLVVLSVSFAVVVRSGGKRRRIKPGIGLRIPLPRCRHVIAKVEAAPIALLAPGRSGGTLLLRRLVRKAEGWLLTALRWIAEIGCRFGSRRKAIVCFSTPLRKQVPTRLLTSPLARRLAIGRRPMRRGLGIVRARAACRSPHPRLPDRTAPRHVRIPLSRTPCTRRRITTLSHLVWGVYAHNRQPRGQNLCIGPDQREACGCQFPVMRLDKAQMWQFIASRPLRVES